MGPAGGVGGRVTDEWYDGREGEGRKEDGGRMERGEKGEGWEN